MTASSTLASQPPRIMHAWSTCFTPGFFFVCSPSRYVHTQMCPRQLVREHLCPCLCLCPCPVRTWSAATVGTPYKPNPNPFALCPWKSFDTIVCYCRAHSITRAVILTLSDIVRDWRGGKLLRPKSDGGGVNESTAAAAPAAEAGARAGTTAGAAGGVAAAAAAALSGQELDPAGAARALRLLFERVSGVSCRQK